MDKSAVYFTDFHVSNETLPQKLRRLMKRAGFEEIDFTDRYAAIKIHFGELGNLAYLRPQYARVVADYVRALGGMPFLTDCNTLYVGSRKNALDHLVKEINHPAVGITVSPCFCHHAPSHCRL